MTRTRFVTSVGCGRGNLVELGEQKLADLRIAQPRHQLPDRLPGERLRQGRRGLVPCTRLTGGDGSQRQEHQQSDQNPEPAPGQ